MAAPGDNSFVGGLRGGFLLQKNGAITGAVTYSVAVGAPPTLCNSGSAPITGTISGNDVKLTAVAGTQTFTLTGSLSSDSTTINGTYASTDGKGCGTAQSDLQFSAKSVPSLTGAVQGNFHSSSSNPAPPLPPFSNQDFAVTGVLTQGNNIGASSATITGTVILQGYPCLNFDPITNTATASVNGQISGSNVILEIFGTDGLNAGQIGAPLDSPNSQPSPVVFEGVAKGGGLVLHGINGYGISSKFCPGGNVPGDLGNICLALGSGTGCTQPILLSPPALTFPPQALTANPSSQTITLSNNDPTGATLSDLTLKLSQDDGPFVGPGDFTGLLNFTEQDTCASPPGSTFSLEPQKSCIVTILFSPQQSCPWMPVGTPPAGASPSLCPYPLNAKLTVTYPNSPDGNPEFAVPISGQGLSAIVPSTPELDFGSEALGEKSPPQLLSFTNQGTSPVQILPALDTPCVNPDVGVLTLPRPLAPGKVSDFQVVTQIIPNATTIDYLCDSDLTSKLPNFQISSDTCSGRTLAPQGSCSLEVTLVPQPSTAFIPALDYFLELDTLQCTDSVTSDCEIDSGRFPVELKANTPSPLRMTPGAGLDFGSWPMGQISDPPLTITLFNDPNDPNAGPVTFTGNQVKGDYIETNDCGATLDPGHTCTLTIVFQPKILGFDPGTVTIGYGVGQIQTVYLRGTGLEPLP